MPESHQVDGCQGNPLFKCQCREFKPVLVTSSNSTEEIESMKVWRQSEANRMIAEKLFLFVWADTEFTAVALCALRSLGVDCEIE